MRRLRLGRDRQRDHRVYEAEVRRRIAIALDEWIENVGWPWRSGGLDAADRHRIAARARRQFHAGRWRRGVGVWHRGMG